MGKKTDSPLKELRAELKKTPDSPRLPELTQLLQDSADGRAEAREFCFRAITVTPENRLARLILARLFYLDSMFEFSIRELVELKQIGAVDSVDRLLAEFGPHATKYLDRMSGSQTSASAEVDAPGIVAEVDLDTDFLEAIDELEDKQ